MTIKEMSDKYRNQLINENIYSQKMICLLEEAYTKGCLDYQSQNDFDIDSIELTGYKRGCKETIEKACELVSYIANENLEGRIKKISVNDFRRKLEE